MSKAPRNEESSDNDNSSDYILRIDPAVVHIVSDMDEERRILLKNQLKYFLMSLSFIFDGFVITWMLLYDNSAFVYTLGIFVSILRSTIIGHTLIKKTRKIILNNPMRSKMIVIMKTSYISYPVVAHPINMTFVTSLMFFKYRWIGYILIVIMVAELVFLLLSMIIVTNHRLKKIRRRHLN
jgi:hypothetical protein